MHGNHNGTKPGQSAGLCDATGLADTQKGQKACGGDIQQKELDPKSAFDYLSGAGKRTLKSKKLSFPEWKFHGGKHVACQRTAKESHARTASHMDRPHRQQGTRASF